MPEFFLLPPDVERGLDTSGCGESGSGAGIGLLCTTSPTCAGVVVNSSAAAARRSTSVAESPPSLGSADGGLVRSELLARKKRDNPKPKAMLPVTNRAGFHVPEVPLAEGAHRRFCHAGSPQRCLNCQQHRLCSGKVPRYLCPAVPTLLKSRFGLGFQFDLLRFRDTALDDPRLAPALRLTTL